MLQRASLLALTFLLAVPAPSWSAKTSAPVTGTAWRTESKAVARVRFRQFSERVRGPATSDVVFGPGNGLAENAFRWTLTDENLDQFAFPGTFTLDAKGKPGLTLDAAAVQTEVQELFEAILAREFAGALPPGVSITYEVKKTKAKFKAVTKGDGSQQGKSTLKLKFLAVASADGKTFPIRVSLKHAGRGAPVP